MLVVGDLRDPYLFWSVVVIVLRTFFSFLSPSLSPRWVDLPAFYFLLSFLMALRRVSKRAGRGGGVRSRKGEKKGGHSN